MQNIEELTRLLILTIENGYTEEDVQQFIEDMQRLIDEESALRVRLLK